MEKGMLYKLAAFTTHSDGGNPAGVWIGETLPDNDTMQGMAADVGFSETAFIAPVRGFSRTVRYFSPEIEVPFCGHATIATGVLLGETMGQGTYLLETAVGGVPVAVHQRDGGFEAALTSVDPESEPASKASVDEALSILGWKRDDLDDAIPPARAYAGAWHLVMALGRKEHLDTMDYEFAALKAFMVREQITTLQLVWRESTDLFHSRNPFPIGGVKEDPATGASAAALGGYLRAAGLIEAPATILIRQGEAMGRPSRITVDIPIQGGIVVSGTAVRI